MVDNYNIGSTGLLKRIVFRSDWCIQLQFIQLDLSMMRTKINTLYEHVIITFDFFFKKRWQKKNTNLSQLYLLFTPKVSFPMILQDVSGVLYPSHGKLSTK